jgi:hypothetical protein
MVTRRTRPRPGSPGSDPIKLRRARIGRATKVGKQVGYGLFLVAILAFAAGAVTDFPAPLVTVVVASLVAGSVILAPAIVFGYGVRAAEREDRQDRGQRGR